MKVEVEENWLREVKWKLDEQREEIRDLRRRLDESEQKNRHLNFRIDHELEPRLKQERDGYDRWVSTDTGEYECDNFSSKIDDIIELVEGADTKAYFEWEDPYGDLQAKILYLIKNRVDDNLMYIDYNET